MNRSRVLAVATLLISVSSAPAQVNIRPNQPPVIGPGAGIGLGAGFGYPFGYLGYYPGAYSSSWSNGFSLYGPPVPTYGSVPGAFGGADQRLSNFQLGNIYMPNGALIGLGRSGSGGAGPRRRHYMGGDDFGAGQSTSGMPSQGQAIIDVRLPVAAAEVYFEGVNTRQQGVKRVFLSPALQPGITYHYQISAKWRDGERTVERSKSVGVRAGETSVVDFTQTEPASNAPVIGTQG